MSAEDAAALQVKVADNDDFAKAGIERSAYLSSLNFQVQTENGTSQIVVSSNKIAHDPFLSFLLDVNSKSTQLMRAYTVLLDPPDYSEPAVATATTTAAAAEAAVTQPAAPTPVPAQAATPEAAASAAPVEAAQASPVSPVAPEASEFAPASAAPGDYGPVKAGETLWHIATQLRSDDAVTMNQVMLAIHDANPRAFDDGRLHVQKGAMLKVPTLTQMRAISPAAAAERIEQIKRGHAAGRTAAKPVRRAKHAKPAVAEQSAAASEAASTPKQEVASAPPAEATAEEPAPAVAAQSAAPAAGAAASASAQAAAESAYAEPAKPGTAAAAPAPAAPAAETAAPDDTLPGSVPTQNAETAPPANATEQPVPSAQPQPIPPAQPAPAKPKVVTVPGESLQGLLYPLIAALGVLLLGLLGLQAWKKRQGAKARSKIEPIQGLKFGIPQQPAAGTVSAVKIPDLPAAAAVAAAQKLPALEDTAQLPQFDSTQMIDAPLDTKASKGISADTVDFDVTGKFEAETMKVDLDGDDPITEADFHLAYGLYDEAALLLSNAAKKEPKRTDIRTKLAETYFRAGKALEFQETAETLKPEIGPAEWQKIAIMGHQLMPDSELFAGGGNLDARSLEHDVDLAFDEPVKEPAPAAARPAPVQPSAHTLDFSLEDFDAVTTAVPTAAASKKPEAPAAGPSDNTLEFNLGDFDLEKPAAKEAVTPAAAPTLPVDEVKIDDDFSLDNMPDDSHAISTGDEAATKLDLARAYVDMGDNETAVTLLNEVMLQGSAEQKKDAEALIKRMA
ncbi:MAG: FimV/HubP family polar landmark protein [Stenotrophobium sp.]